MTLPEQPSADSASADSRFFAMQECSVAFGGLIAVKDVSFRIDRGDLVGLIGPNGAGKTTIFNLITGVYAPTTGQIIFGGKPIAWPIRRDQQRSGLGPVPQRGTTARAGSHTAELRPRHLAAAVSRVLGREENRRSGICRTFQNIRLFQGLNVLDNVLIAANSQIRQSLLSAAFRTARFYEAEAEARREAFRLLETLHLQQYAATAARSLPYGAQRRLEIARALATRPELLLLDEPAAGMNPQESAELMEMIRWIREEFNLTILLIEHDMKVVMGVCHRILVLENGSLIADGSPAEIRSNPAVIAAYLGAPDDEDPAVTDSDTAAVGSPAEGGTVS